MSEDLENKPSEQEATEETVKGLNKDLFGEPKESTNIPLSCSIQKTSGEELVNAIAAFAQKEKLTAAQKEELKKTLNSALTGQWRNGRYDGIFSDDKMTAQALELNNRKLGIMHPSVSGGNGKLSGAAALLAISNAAGVGKETDVILPASGIRLRLGVFREKEILALQVEISERRLDVGRETHGALLSADDSHLVVSIVDFILRHVVKASVRLPEDNFVEELSKLILVSDIPALMTGALEGIYPDGYPFIHRCMNPECGYNTYSEEKNPMLLFRYLYRMDPSRVTPKRFRHLSAPWDAHTPEMVKEYQESSAYEQNVVVTEKNGRRISVDIKNPTYYHHKTVTIEWLTSVMVMVDDALVTGDAMSSTDARTRRANYIANAMKRLSLMRHGSWVNRVIISTDESEQVIEEPKDIFDSLEFLCKDGLVVDSLWPKIDEVRIKSLFGYTGILAFDCPECGEEQQVEKPEHSVIIPINVTQYFFVIMGYRILENLQ